MTLPPSIMGRASAPLTGGIQEQKCPPRRPEGPRNIHEVYLQSKFTKRWIQRITADLNTNTGDYSERKRQSDEYLRQVMSQVGDMLSTPRKGSKAEYNERRIKFNEQLRSLDSMLKVYEEKIHTNRQLPQVLKPLIYRQVELRVISTKTNLCRKFLECSKDQTALNTTRSKKKRPNLPEESKSVLRKWLSENFHHPYPSEGEKLELARLASISVEQVNNWFINARGREWRPKIRHMAAEQGAGRSTALTDVMMKVSAKVSLTNPA